jgi:hypothetical protein
MTAQTQSQRLTPTAATPAVSRAGHGHWLWSWPLLLAGFTYLYLLFHAAIVLRDGDTYWHIAAGRWILEHGAVPTRDPFSHTMHGAAWTASSWLSEVLLHLAHQFGGLTFVVAMTALAFAVTIALLTRALLGWLEPIYALLFAALAIFMTAGHALARPHVLAMPMMVIWTIALVRASDAGRTPRLWILPVMCLWANLHGGFTIGLAIAFAFALEAILAARERGEMAMAAKSWGVFLGLAVLSALVTPHGTQGIMFTWQVMFESGYALQRIEEFRSPDFHIFQPLEIWLLGGMALALYQGLRLPAIRLLIVLGLLHLALKHNRNIELVGLLGPLIVAGPLGVQWRARKQAGQQLESADRFFEHLSHRAGRGAVLVSLVGMLAVPLVISGSRPLSLPEASAPVQAIEAVRQAGIKGNVLNRYSWGGYLVYLGIPPFIDGRADMYGNALLQEYVEALALKEVDALPKLLDKYKISWTLLEPHTATVTMLDGLPGWRRLYADQFAVVHVRDASSASTRSPDATEPDAAR